MLQNVLHFMSVFNVHNDVYSETGFKFFLSLGQFVGLKP